MKRDIIIIDEEKCIGCGDCVGGCHEGALQIIDGKARLIGDLLCDGLGACIGHCPVDALQIIQREAEPYDEFKVMDGLVLKGEATIKAHLLHLQDHKQVQFYNEGIQYLLDHNLLVPEGLTWMEESDQGCCGSDCGDNCDCNKGDVVINALTHWPIQLHLVMPSSPHFKKADLLLAADCTAFALGNFHNRLLNGRKLTIACPKLDNYDGYLEKLVAFIDEGQIHSLTVATMEVPCCGGLWALAVEASNRATRKIPLERVIVNIDAR